MKRYLCIILAALALVSVFALGSCDDGKKNTSSQPTEATAPSETKPSEKKTGALKEYAESFIKGDKPIYGAWKLSNLDYMYIIFRNDNLAELAMDSEGYLSKYKFDEKAGTLTVQLLPGTIDGKYNYEFSENNKKLTLTLNGNSLELVKDDSYSMVPEAPEEVEIDESILGWWQSVDGIEYYFGEDGLMYNDAIARETYYTYTAGNNKITAVYNYGGETEETLSYKLKGDTLTIDGEDFTRKESV